VLRPGRVLHVAINRGKEQAFGEPGDADEHSVGAAFNDILAGQVGKAKAAQSYLMKVTPKGARTADQLHRRRLRAVGRRSPLANSPLDRTRSTTAPRPARLARPGSQWWENESLKAEPLQPRVGAREREAGHGVGVAGVRAGTNFPGHYFFGDPGSLAGSMAVELPVLKLTEVDQEAMRGVFRSLCDLRISPGARRRHAHADAASRPRRS
jgi:hypothetical protein